MCMGKLIDLTGQRFGSLTVKAMCCSVTAKKRQAYAVCLCDCGSQQILSSSDLKRRKKAFCKNCHFHGKINTPEYKVWNSIKQRCLNPNNAGFKDYGGRGISVCDRWKSFKLFLSDMGARPSSLHSIERIDNKKGYSPGN